MYYLFIHAFVHVNYEIMNKKYKQSKNKHIFENKEITKK